MRALALGLLLVAGGGAAQGAPSENRITDEILQIGILRQRGAVSLQPQGNFSVIDQTTGEVKRLESGRAYRLESDDGKRVLLGPFLFLGPTRLLPDGPEDFVYLGSRKYHGNLVFKPGDGGTLTVVDEVGLEEYLEGVLPREMSPDWPIEALKAQAVVARTFALANMGKYAQEGYDLSDDVRSQVYSGIEVDSARVKQAVRDTAGEVLFYQGELLPVFFHACCGGNTADPAVIWGMAGRTPKPLRGVGDRFCKGAPSYLWSATFPKEVILSALVRHGIEGGVLRWVRAGERAPGGFLKTLRFEVDRQSFSLRANEFRKWIGTTQLKSTQIWRVIERKGSYEFVGRGFGHGVGLCQWGARGQAVKGRGYRKILSYYFPGANLVRRSE
ncbi:MAG TPA: SpoIID/LytB domain-containing protein [Elusimicrobiota bacterium]|nr:SpoIID/LytB domain-containing protein [Elusimicrobiota bacterium]